MKSAIKSSLNVKCQNKDLPADSVLRTPPTSPAFHAQPSLTTLYVYTLSMTSIIIPVIIDHEERHHLTVSSRSTLSSIDSSELLAAAAGDRSSQAPCACVSRRRSRHRRQWPEVATVGRALFIMSVAFFVVGVLVTVFGFGEEADLTDAETRSRQLPLQVRYLS